jgi:hypothetical protein
MRTLEHLFTALLFVCLLAPVCHAQNQTAEAPPPDEEILNATEKLGDLPFRLPAPKLDEERFDPASLYRDICQKALGAVSCKHPMDFNFIGRKDNALRFNAFYASKAADFYCFAEYESVVLSSPAWGKIRVTVPYSIDHKARCITADVGMTFCNRRTRIRSCAKPQE